MCTGQSKEQLLDKHGFLLDLAQVSHCDDLGLHLVELPQELVLKMSLIEIILFDDPPVIIETVLDRLEQVQDLVSLRLQLLESLITKDSFLKGVHLLFELAVLLDELNFS